MKCSQFELKDYVFGELSAVQRREVDQHIASCATCREELERLTITQAALATMRDEDPPRRIAFVSDKVFEPTWWQSLWNSGPRLGFASALVLAAAILAHGWMQPAVKTAPVQTAVAFNQREIDARVADELSKRLPAAVDKAVEQQSDKLTKVISETEKRLSFERRADLVAFQEEVKYLKRRLDVTTVQLARAERGQN